MNEANNNNIKQRLSENKSNQALRASIITSHYNYEAYRSHNTSPSQEVKSHTSAQNHPTYRLLKDNPKSKKEPHICQSHLA